MEWLP
jgi:hypothetical protein